MSAESIARWNAIPMKRTFEEIIAEEAGESADDQNPFERDQANFDDDDDDILIASRSPSPGREPKRADDMDIDKYDEYVPGVAREVITVETRINASNKGFAMLAKMGWSEGQPLGLSGDGRTDPVPFAMKADTSGVGKLSQDLRRIEETVAQRRALDAERQQNETLEQRKAREDAVARASAIRNEVTNALAAFYCSLCDKQFKNVAQYDEHTNSYAHHHKVREKDMKASLKGAKGDIEERKAKERKREEKEMKRLAKAAGIKIAAPPKPLGGGAAPKGDAEGTKSGWAAVSSSAPPVASRTTGWAKVSSTVTSSGPAGPAQPSTSQGWAAVAAPAPPPPPTEAPPAPGIPSAPQAGWSRGTTNGGFQSGGYSSLPDSAASPAPPPLSAAPPAPTSALSADSRAATWPQVSGATSEATTAPSGPPPSAPPAWPKFGEGPGPRPPLAASTPSAPAPPPAPAQPVVPAPIATPAVAPVMGVLGEEKAKKPKKPKGVVEENQRQGWQKFKSGRK
ncbi:hypothetical protein PUNSTDRAFT_41116 [Punctularia strigosozonata HHB-11173 SS5]|uniref:uncharacterized protein n=1 Tax=Punctularia strigosozonata (strain HHB-11173) TaxID=741275 RepID=UPI00044185C1|nr:uncharacterized protein PUNSTDRAFT_41116 [Punctularia strigosozonata HHB-11173 SS5]EIN13580.1 hypothetical protein PUNSTDRAFT_41116 [Punctularia strigosozonata HHB-11173 SS5]